MMVLLLSLEEGLHLLPGSTSGAAFIEAIWLLKVEVYKADTFI